MEPTQGRERILCIGGWGAGKSSAWVKVAHWLTVRDSPGRLFIIDTDMAVDRMRVGNEKAFDSRVTAYDVNDWEDFTGAATKINNSIPTKDDWLILDMADKPWNAVQEFYVDQIFNKSTENYFIEARKRNQKNDTSGNPLDGWQDWSVINKIYKPWMLKLLRFPGHILFCSPAVPVIDTGKKGDDSTEIKSVFGSFGVKPGGQKDLGFQFHTILLFSDAGNRGYRLSTIKDRQREKLKNEELKDFVPNYLVRVAGWRL